MSSSNLELLDYIIFFESEPEWFHSDGWYYGVRFLVKRDKECLLVTLAPDEAELAVEWWQDGILRIKFKTVMAISWQIHSRNSQEWLWIQCNTERSIFCRIQLKPYIQVEWEMTW